MTTVALASFSGAPGTTTAALATAAALATTAVPEPVLVELASSGGVVAGWYDLPAEPGLRSLALALGPDEPDVLAHAQALPGGLPAVVAPPSGSQVAKLLGARGPALADYLRRLDATIVADCGRVAIDSPLRPVLEASSLVGIVVRPNREDFRLAATGLAELNTVVSGPLPAGWVLVGESPWSLDEITAHYGLPVLANLAEDAGGADAVAGRRRLRRHSPLSRSVRSFADDIAKHLRVASADDPLGYLRPDSDPAPGARPGARTDRAAEAGFDDESGSEAGFDPEAGSDPGAGFVADVAPDAETTIDLSRHGLRSRPDNRAAAAPGQDSAPTTTAAEAIDDGRLAAAEDRS